MKANPMQFIKSHLIRAYSLVIAFVLCNLLLSSCTPLEQGSQPEHRIYMVTANTGRGQHQLVLVDSTTWKVYQTVGLPNSWSDSLGLDPQGRIWIGFSGSFDFTDNRVQVYTEEGTLITTLTPCDDPSAGINFVENHAFVVCAGDGLQGSVAVIDIDTLKVVKNIPLSLPDKPYLLISSAADENNVIISGLTSGTKETSYSVLTFIDTHTLTVKQQLDTMENADIWQILVDRQRYYCLNVGSWRVPQQQDILQLNALDGTSVQPLQSANSPLWGEIADRFLFAYHDPTHNQPNDDPHRQLSRMDLQSGEIETWRLPDYWNAGDLAVRNGKFLLSTWFGKNDQQDGIYEFDPVTGKLVQLIHVANADKMIVVQ